MGEEVSIWYVLRSDRMCSVGFDRFELRRESCRGEVVVGV